ncbi:uncharacterized protein Sry-alpha isoform X2 [Procambarus clarkii]|uniref:uncharacterized protein Sry-alpha isoform X2 n=1 Tax=Procambarus clarkii TaxID=6728 RepID=UPI0037448722
MAWMLRGSPALTLKHSPLSHTPLSHSHTPGATTRLTTDLYLAKMEDISRRTKSKCVLNVLGPIANQVLELRSRQGVVCDATTVIKLLKQCLDLEKSCALLVSRLTLYAASLMDDVLSAEIKRVKKQLDKVTDSLTDATRDLHRGDVGVRDNEEVWASIVEDTEQLLSALTEALLAWDRAQQRQVTGALEHLKKCLHHLEHTCSIPHLPDEFQVVVSASLDLFNLLEVRCGDLYRRAQRETVELLALQLCHTLPLLASTCVATVTQPFSKHIKACHELVSSRLHVLLTDLGRHVTLGDDNYDLEEAGFFTTCVDKVLGLLLEGQDNSNKSASDSTEPLSEHIKPLLEEVLRHGIAVAYCSSPDDNHVIMAVCENVLKQMKVLVSLERTGTPDAVDVQISCDVLADSVELLEQKINTALIRLIAQTFADPLTPLQSLMSMLGSEVSKLNRNKLDASIADLDLHMDAIFQIAGFATACTSDGAKVLLIRDSLFTLEWLESCFVPSVVSAYTDPDPNSYARASMLAHHWERSVKQLWDTLYNIVDPSAFTLVTKQEVHQLWAELKERIYTQDVTWIHKQVSRVVTLVSGMLVLNEKNSFLTNSQTEDLKLAIREVKRSEEAVVASPSMLPCHRSMIKRVQLTLTLISRLANTLNEDNIQTYEEFSVTVEPHKVQNKLPSIKLTKAEEQQLFTSNIEDIPIDVATPIQRLEHQGITAIARSPSTIQEHESQQQKSLKRCLRSISRLGGVRARAGNRNMSGHHSQCVQAVTSETVGCDTCIDITKFLSRSTNTMSSTRASRRNFTLRVKEISLDMNGALQTKVSLPASHSEHSMPDQPKETTAAGMDALMKPLETRSEMASNSTPQFSTSTGEDYHNDSRLREVSDLIAQEDSLPLLPQKSFGEELSGILENLTSLANNFTTRTPPSSKKRKCQWESFDDKESADKTANLRGIKLQNASFNPQFPEITFGDVTKIFNENQSHIEEETGNDSDIHDHAVWQDFTAILQKNTSMKNIFDFSNNFNNCQYTKTISTFGKKTQSCDSVTCKDKLSEVEADLSDTPFFNQTVPISKTCLSRICNFSNPVAAPSDTSISSSSTSVDTPQRLQDLQFVNQRLTTLRSTM